MEQRKFACKFLILCLAGLFVRGVRAIPEECTQPKDDGNCGGRAAPILRFYYDTDAEQCKSFQYYGCGGNDNRWQDLVSCREYCEVKEGDCPALAADVQYLCENLCGFDTDCPEEEKCCAHSCGTYCTAPAPPKAEICPDPNSFTQVCVTYHDQCQENHECEGKKICCLVAGCGKECMNPAGFCPAVPADTFGTCDERCPLDGNCPGDQLCCSNGCGHLCKDPAPPCQQAIVVGPCKAAQPSWGYNIDTGDCEFFNYGGCQGNDNRYATRDACCRVCGCNKPGFCPAVTGAGICLEQCSSDADCKGDNKCCSNGCGHVCVPPAPPCEQPIEPGPCEALNPSWGFNPQSEQCEPFNYGGCQGNDNRYPTFEDCCSACGGPNSCVCEAPLKIGPCRAALRRWYFNIQSGECERFSWGGCQPNANNFPDEISCKARCGKRDGFCPDPNSFDRVCAKYHDQCQEDHECKGEQICCLVAGCGKECMDPAAPCQQAIVVGPCEAADPSWGYNIDTEDCEFFNYGGCQGNDNRYATRDACCRVCGCNKPGFCPAVTGAGICLEQCSSDADCKGDNKCCSNGCGHVCVPPAPPCEQPIEPGPCEALNPSWGFNPQSGQCEPFNYGGCQGNDNRYPTFEDCCSACGRPNSCVCEAPLKRGPCRAALTRWYLNVQSGECERFSWGGCQPNANNFPDEISCKARCGKRDGFCPDPNSFNRNCLVYNDQCQENYECKGEQICCLVAGCGKECMDPAEPCKQPIVIGPCDGTYPSWGYNSQTGVCEEFVYGGCEGNDNRFISKDECCKGCGCSKPGFCPAIIGAGICQEQCSFDVECKGNDKCCSNGCGHVCVPPAPPCEQPIEPGPCKALNPSWGFNPQSGQCEPFNYGGCQGNDNRYPTFEECCSACGGPISCVCEAPLKIGPCRAALARWYFNIQSGECERFSWGGCHPNANNFPDEISCKARCGKRDGFCPDPKSFTKVCVTYHDQCQENHECKGEQICCLVAGCGKECMDPAEPCKQPIVIGPCDGTYPSWGYNSQTGVCEEFVYGGCEGNDNRFISKDECCKGCKCSKPGFCPAIIGAGICQEQCSFDVECKGNDKCCSNGCGHVCVPPAPPCEQPIEPGPCEALNPSWGFDPQSGQCEAFNYGGCQGNDNRYPTFEECCSACGGPTSCVCEAPLKIGPCRAAINRWYFNIQSGECELFSWGGCHPNANNFLDEISCRARCGKRDVTCPTPPPPSIPDDPGCRFTCKSDGECKHLDVCCPQGCPGTYCARPEPRDACELPINSGECKANFKRWGYDQQQGKCVQFTYGGCLGNINNFATEHQCKVACDCDIDRCYQGIDPGPCTPSHPEYKWGFDLKTGRCKQFAYGGHGGNENRFCSKRECRRKCRHAIKRQDHVCYQSIEANPLIKCVWCNPHWAYVPCKNECVQFCRCGTDTDNAFKCRDECEEHCVRDEDDDGGKCDEDDDWYFK